MGIIGFVLSHVWFTDAERALAEALVGDFAELFGQCGVAETASLKMRTEDVIVSYLHVRRVEHLLAPSVVEAATATTANEERVIDAAGRARERLRKAMKELEDYCTRAGAPIDQGIAGLMKPILKKAEGVIEDALAFEQKKERKRSKS
ncbi:MAG TPA: hypothetical protein PLO37_21050 [Candidatus Hydrogenedentes bacterium]|nr:hypothetical protein [Candidatus Hydrogenedentota bacterium]HPG69342.1 hypothetical protein [Candidatus Hydrogenedentota bacterium]